MKKLSSRTGSAILVVLGMTAFLLVSAIAFSAYMRYSRLPSSYLRRSSASRLLVKAALARAIDAVDTAVNNNPHPNVGDNYYSASQHRTPYDQADMHNSWQGRVLMGTNVTINADSDIDSSTVSPLCLEALAYIPPPLVNEARFYSRRSPTAYWHSLDYDSGRYAFCALDVSDYFDINRMRADVPRASAPNRRITLSYLFERGDEHTGLSSGATAWETFMDQYRQVDDNSGTIKFAGSTYPLVSLADFNLALYKQGGVGSCKSAFCQFVTGASGTSFYGKGTDSDIYTRMTFVTDGWFPGEDEESSSSSSSGSDTVTRYDLNDGEYQPFEADFLETERPALSDCVLGKRLQSDGTMKWLEHLSGLGVAALYDYLDPDHVPISLAVPTTERVPMICGLQANFPSAKFAVNKVTEPEDVNQPKVMSGDDTSRKVQVVVRYRIDSSKLTPGFMAGKVKTLLVFPFSHTDPTDGTFSLDGRFSMFLSSADMTLRTGEANDVLHLTTPVIGDTALDANTGLMNVKLQDQAVSFTEKITSEEQAVKEVESGLNAQAMGTYFSQSGNELLAVTYEWTQTQEVSGGGLTQNWTPSFQEVFAAGGDYITAVHCGIPALLANGTVDPQSKDANLLGLIKSGNDKGLELRLNAAVWMRVKNSDGKIVDMVPACLTDDNLQNKANDPDPRMAIVGRQEFSGQPFPLFRFNTKSESENVKFTLSINGLEALTSQDQEVTLSPTSAMVADPRYNYAPEHWFQVSGELSKDNWLKENQTGNGNRDHDIFMATSDAGYLQSPQEVAFLPRFTDLVKYGNSVSSGNMTAPDGGSLTSLPASFANTRNQDMMWRTFDPIDVDSDAFLDLPWTSAGTGYKVNPFSDSTNVLMSVFANTPIDWKRASTNEVEKGDNYYDMAAKDFNQKYAYNAYSSGGKFAWRDLEEIAGRYMRQVRSDTDNWEDALANLGNWTSADKDKFCGVELDGNTDDLWDVDRKFLYGFWSDCFAAKQQLYLIFVRAEPVMMGSGMVGQIPPQLGARAVALVWRDPTKTEDAKYPHQTRVLFYRQFE